MTKGLGCAGKDVEIGEAVPALLLSGTQDEGEAESSEPGFQFIKTPFQVTTNRTIDIQMYTHVLFLFSLSPLSVGAVRVYVRACVCPEVDNRCLLQLLYTLFSETGVPTVFGGC